MTASWHGTGDQSGDDSPVVLSILSFSKLLRPGVEPRARKIVGD